MSDLESDLLQQIIDHGLPDPVQQHRFARHLGRTWRFDFAWVEDRVAVEVDGGTFIKGLGHGTGQSAERDAVKSAVALCMGWRVVRVTTHMVADGRALAVIVALLRGYEEDAAQHLCDTRCKSCDETKTRRNRRLRQKARESDVSG